MYAVEDSLVELAHKAGSFMVNLVEQESIATSDSDAMKPVIDGLTKYVLTTFMHYYFLVLTKELHSEMKRVLGVVKKISSQRSTTRLLLSASDKYAVDECNRQMALSCGMFGVRKPINRPLRVNPLMPDSY